MDDSQNFNSLVCDKVDYSVFTLKNLSNGVVIIFRNDVSHLRKRSKKFKFVKKF